MRVVYRNYKTPVGEVRGNPFKTRARNSNKSNEKVSSLYSIPTRNAVTLPRKTIFKIKNEINIIFLKINQKNYLKPEKLKKLLKSYFIFNFSF